jgi:hypothetical protein
MRTPARICAAIAHVVLPTQGSACVHGNHSAFGADVTEQQRLLDAVVTGENINDVDLYVAVERDARGHLPRSSMAPNHARVSLLGPSVPTSSAPPCHR